MYAVWETTIYFTNNYSWTNIYAHYWQEENASTVTTKWPGVQMTLAGKNGDNQDVYSIVLTGPYDSIIFNGKSGGNDTQTEDITLDLSSANAYFISGDGAGINARTVGTWNAKAMYFNNTSSFSSVNFHIWKETNHNVTQTSNSSHDIYIIASNSAPRIHYWNGSSGSSWPGENMTEIGKVRYNSQEYSVYKYNIGNNSNFLINIANDENGDHGKTGDQTFNKDTFGKYIYLYNSTNSSLTKTNLTQYYTVSNSTTWPGPQAKLVSGTVYCYFIDINSINRVIFSDNGSSQTAILEIPSDDKNYYDNGWKKY